MTKALIKPMTRTVRVKKTICALEEPSVSADLCFKKANPIDDANRSCNIIPSSSKDQIENMNLEDKVKILAVIITVLIEEKSRMQEKLRGAQQFFGNVLFVRSKLLPKEDHGSTNIFRKCVILFSQQLRSNERHIAEKLLCSSQFILHGWQAVRQRKRPSRLPSSH